MVAIKPTHRTVLRIPFPLKDAVTAQATIEGRSFNNLASVLLEEGLAGATVKLELSARLAEFKGEPTGLRIPKPVWDKLRKRAAAERRTEARLAVILLYNGLQKRKESLQKLAEATPQQPAAKTRSGAALFA